jgi:hypothetical protein
MKTQCINQEMKRILIPVSLSLLLLILPLAPGHSMPMGKKSNFSGTWVLNEQKSELGEYGRMMASNKLVILQKGKKMTMERFGTAPTGEEYSYKENYTLDGKECIIPLFEQSKKTATAVLSKDKKILTIKSLMELSFEGNEMKINTVEEFNIGDGGKTLIIKETASTDYGDMVVTIVYDLQQ